ncbi:hypothetical protein NLJ89_g8093 [Agrocybe chaxingu]|uniref:Tyr recombinase domain-containing protein n=1 Tax=Agrocybe chaxingu TaxID=84603 RepID=A0A9W8MSG7_9AGAR|nr:hypothetical protein NLJ89_g8093 [Agrocybe chaxingu]
MIEGTRPARQRARAVWSKEKLVHERAIALGHALDDSTLGNYGSALNSYLTFVKNHDFPVEPTPDTLSFFTVYTCHYLNPRSVSTYLSGIISQLEPFFPEARTARKSMLVRRTLQGCMRMNGKATVRKRALTVDDLHTVINHYQHSSQHDDLLFVAMLITGFFALLRLGELTFPDDSALRNWKKVTRRDSVKVSDTQYEFFLPGHKADRFFEGNRIIIMANRFGHQPLHHFSKYLKSRDALHPTSSALWLTKAGHIPKRSFFIKRLQQFFTNDVAGQSMRAGGATALAERGVPPPIIQAAGRWASDAFLIYIRKNPTLLQGLLHANARNQVQDVHV